jgi:hypothetical protein
LNEFAPPRQLNRWASASTLATSELMFPHKVSLAVNWSQPEKEYHMRKLTTALFLALAVIASNASAKTYSQAQGMALHLVQKIYVEDMGASPEAARFRLLLEDQLSENGFTVVAKREEADAILSGVTSVLGSGCYGSSGDISVTARLVSSDGHRLWSTNMGGQIYILNPVKSLKFTEPVEYRAQELAKKLRHAREQSAKTAGIKRH